MAENTARTFEQLVARGRTLLTEDSPTTAHSQFQHWDRDVAEWLDADFSGTGFSADWSSRGTSNLVHGHTYYPSFEVMAPFRVMVQGRLSWLARLAMVRSHKAVAVGDAGEQATPSRRVFVVHGRDERLREAVARYLTKLELIPVILHEQPNQGRTIIEKIVDYADVGFAVVLLTGDDEGRLSNEEGEKLQPRARQNVILELGFFLGWLGRAKVRALCESGIERPSDYDGVLFFPVDESDAWQLKLAKEIRAAGVPVDLNLL